MCRSCIGLTLLVISLGVGCSSSSNNPNAPARISGQVLYDGKAVSGGNIYFFSEGKGTYQSSLGPDGTYEIVDIPLGNMVVTVETESINPAHKTPTYGSDKGAAVNKERMQAENRGGKQTSPGMYRKIPSKYDSPKTSPLTVTIESGRQVKEFVLVD